MPMVSDFGRWLKYFTRYSLSLYFTVSTASVSSTRDLLVRFLTELEFVSIILILRNNKMDKFPHMILALMVQVKAIAIMRNQKRPVGTQYCNDYLNVEFAFFYMRFAKILENVQWFVIRKTTILRPLVSVDFACKLFREQYSL